MSASWWKHESSLLDCHRYGQLRSGKASRSTRVLRSISISCALLFETACISQVYAGEDQAHLIRQVRSQAHDSARALLKDDPSKATTGFLFLLKRDSGRRWVISDVVGAPTPHEAAVSLLSTKPTVCSRPAEGVALVYVYPRFQPSNSIYASCYEFMQQTRSELTQSSNLLELAASISNVRDNLDRQTTALNSSIKQMEELDDDQERSIKAAITSAKSNQNDLQTLTGSIARATASIQASDAELKRVLSDLAAKVDSLAGNSNGH